MSELIAQIVPLVPVYAWPVILVVLGGLYIYRKIDGQRKETKVTRDNDSLEIHDKLMKHDWEINQIKDDNGHRDNLIEDLTKQVNILNTSIATTNIKLDTLIEAIKDLKK